MSQPFLLPQKLRAGLPGASGLRLGPSHRRRRTLTLYFPGRREISRYLDPPQRGKGFLAGPQSYDVSFHQQAHWQVDQMSISVGPVQGPGWRKGHVEVGVHGIWPPDLPAVLEGICQERGEEDHLTQGTPHTLEPASPQGLSEISRPFLHCPALPPPLNSGALTLCTLFLSDTFNNHC